MVEGVHFFMCMEVPSEAFYTSRAWRVLVLWKDKHTGIMHGSTYMWRGVYFNWRVPVLWWRVVFFGLQMEGAILTLRISST